MFILFPAHFHYRPRLIISHIEKQIRKCELFGELGESGLRYPKIRIIHMFGGLHAQT